MPKDKDRKRLVRDRMKKTGESYTAARARLLRKNTSRKPSSLPDDYATLAGMSDDTLSARTGKTWSEWVRALDAIDATSLSHREIAAHVRETLGLPGWWAQTVTVGYERIRGLRQVGQRRDGMYEAHKSKTVAVPIGALYRAFADEERRAEWLPDTGWTIRTAIADRSMRVTWHDGSSVDVYFTAKGDARSQVTIQHGKLPSQAAQAEMKAYWADRLGALAERLTARPAE